MNENQNKDIEKLLQDTADTITPNVMFAGRLENELKRAHKSRKSFQFPSLKQALSVFAPALALAAFAILVVFVIQKMQPSRIGSTPETLPTKVDPALPAPVLPSYDRNGMTMVLDAKFPPAPETMKVYTVKDEALATVDDVRALARQFKMDGDVYEVAATMGSGKEYLVADGNRQLRVRSDRYFTYYPDYVSWTSNVLAATPPPDAESSVKKFMQAYGFDSDYRIEQLGAFNYAALALSPDDFDVRNENFQINGLQFRFNQNDMIMVDATLLGYDETANMSILSAEEAFQKIIDPNNLYGYGYIENMQRTGSMMVDDKIIKPEDMKLWTHIRPLDETLTYNGLLSSTAKSVDGGAPLILLDGYTVTGNVNDIPADMPNAYIEARGQFHEANGVKAFELESWKPYDGYEEFIRGVIRREGDQFIFDSTDGKKYILQDVPADVPLPMDPAFVNGITRGDIFDWKTINNFGGGGGGGGGGGATFYKINFSGKPVPFPTPIPATPTPESPALNQTPVEGLRGTLTINIFPQKDGTERANYLFFPYTGEDQGAYMLLKGNVDEALNAYHNRPIDIWGTTGGIDEKTGESILIVEHYEAAYPDLQFQLISGTQKIEMVEGQSVILITADDGETYVALMPVGGTAVMPVSSPGKAPNLNDPATAPEPVLGKMTYEGLLIPGESFAGYPGIRVFNSAPEMADGNPIPISIVSDKPYSYEGPPPPTSMTIEKIELAYFAHDQRWQNYEPAYLQPVWRFSGHYEDGSEFEILVQALKPEFLLPELEDEPVPPPG